MFFATMIAFVFTSCSHDHKNEKSEPVIKQTNLEIAYQQYMEDPSVQTLNVLFDYSHQSNSNAKFKTIDCLRVYYDWSLPVDPLTPREELESAKEFLSHNPRIMNDTLSEIYRVDPRVRGIIATMLGQNGDARSLKLLREWLSTEDSKRLTNRIKRSIDQLMSKE